MLVDRNNLKRHLPWLIVVALTTLAAATWQLFDYWQAGRWPGGSSLPGLTFGIAGAAIIFFELLIWPRKRLRALRLGRVQSWMRAHIWLGLLSVPLVLLHSGGEWGGAVSRNLSILFAVVILSGVWGLALQQLLPRRMLNQVPAETIYSEIDHLALQNCFDAEELVLAVCGTARPGDAPRLGTSAGQGTGNHVAVGVYRTVGKTRGRILQTIVPASAVPNSEPLRTAFYDEIHPFLEQGGRRRRSPLSDPRRADDLFHALKGRLDPAAHAVVDEVAELCFQRRQFDLQMRMHHWLHGWLLVHAPLSVMLVVVLVLHIYYACKYW